MAAPAPAAAAAAAVADPSAAATAARRPSNDKRDIPAGALIEGKAKRYKVEGGPEPGQYTAAQVGLGVPQGKAPLCDRCATSQPWCGPVGCGVLSLMCMGMCPGVGCGVHPLMCACMCPGVCWLCRLPYWAATSLNASHDSPPNPWRWGAGGLGHRAGGSSTTMKEKGGGAVSVCMRERGGRAVSVCMHERGGKDILYMPFEFVCYSYV